MALGNGQDGLLSQLMKLTPQALGKVLPGLDLPDAALHTASLLTETPAFGDNPGNLRMLCHVPEGLAPGAPLVVVLHGCTQTAAEYDYGTGWSTLAERFGFALLLPEQRRANNPNLCFDWFQPEDVTRGAGEVASIAAMVMAMTDAHRLARDRVYVTGLSAGGGMAAALLATYPDHFAGGAIIAGLPFGSASGVPEAFGVMGQGRIRPARALGDRVRAASAHRGPWPMVSIWQGTSDTTVNPVNAEELRKQWGDVHGVAESAPEESTTDSAAHRIWRRADGGVAVETYVVNGLGHATPIDPTAAMEDARCGTSGASRFILPSGISSTYRIAERWGLTGQRRVPRPGAARTVQSKTAAAERVPAWQAFLPSGSAITDPEGLVAKVLRSAGFKKD